MKTAEEIWADSQVVAIATRRAYRLTDLGNGERFAAVFQNRVRFCHPWGKWLTRNPGGWWQMDDSGAVDQLAKAVVRLMYDSAARIDDERDRKELISHAVKSESHSRIEAMLACAQSEPGIPVHPAELDGNPFVFGCANGVIDLRTGELRPYSAGDLITKISTVDYDPSALAPTWATFLDRVLPDPAVRGFVQRMVGYSMLGLVRDHVLPVFWGTGSNGKGTLLESVKYVFGDYAIAAAPTLLLETKHTNHPTEQADLFGKRLVITSEVKANSAFDVDVMKRLTGGDTIKARRMREDFWEFTPSHKLILAANHKPRVKDTTHSSWRRLRLVPFGVEIPEHEQDGLLPERLQTTEAAGILAWCVAGCLEYQRIGLAAPESVRAATESYRRENDPLRDFVATEIVRVSPDLRTRSSDVYDAYKTWCEQTDNEPMAQRTFGAAMVEKGFEARRTAGTRWYYGVALATEKQGSL